MAKDNVIGLEMGLDVTDLKLGIQQVGKSLKEARNNFNLATAGMDKWTKSSEGLTAKLGQLETQLAGQKKTVDLYRAEIERVSKQEGDHSKELENLAAKLQKAEIEVKKTESSIRKYSSSLADVTAENRKAESSLGQLTSKIAEQKKELSDLQFEYQDTVLTYGKNSKQAKALEKQISSLTNELSDNEKQLKDSEKAVEALSGEFNEAGDSAGRFQSGLDGIRGLGGLVAKGVTAIGAGIAGLGTAFLATAEGSREFRTNMGKLETGFETVGLKAEQATETYRELYSVVADEGKATEATAHIAKLAKSQEDLQKWVNISTGVYATFGDSLPIENLAEASNETAKTGQITGGLADALNWAGVSEEAFQEKLDNLSTEQERNQLITETLNGLYDEASQKYQQVNKDVIESNKAQVSLSETMAQLGEKAEPIMTAVKNGFNEILQVIIELLNGADFEAIQAGIENAFAYFIDTIIPAIKDGFTWIMDNKDTLVAGIVAIGTAMLAWNVVTMIQGVVGAIKGWMLVTEGMTVAQKALNLVMSANPIGIVITAITALVAAFVYLWNTSEDFRNFWINLWENIKKATSTAINTISKFFSDLWSGIKKIWGNTVKWFSDIGSKIANGFKKALDNVSKFFTNAWNSIKKIWGSVSSWFSDIAKKIVNGFKNLPKQIGNFFTNAWNNVKKAWGNVTSFFADIGEKIIKSFSSLPSRMLSIGSDLVTGLWNGIKDMTGWITGKLDSFGDSVLGGIKDFFGIHSPSRVMAGIGKNLVEGLGQGIEKNEKEAISPFENLGEEIVNSVTSIQDELKKTKFTETLKGLGVKVESPFKGWTHAKLNDEIVRLKAEYDKLEAPLKKNLELSNSQGDSIELMTERAELYNQRIQKQNDLVEILNYKMGVYERQGADPAQWATDDLERFQKELDNTIIASDQLSEELLQISDNTNITVEPEVNINPWTEAWKQAFGFTSKGFANMGEELKTQVEKAVDKIKTIGSHIGTMATQAIDLYNQSIDNEIQDLEVELEQYSEMKEKELEIATENHEAELESLEEARSKGQITDQQYNQNKINLENQYKAAKQSIEQQIQQAEQDTLRKKNELAEKQFRAQKATSIAETLIAGAQAIVKGFAQLGPIGGAINAAIQAGLTAAQIAIISKQQYVPMLAKGGIVDGATHAIIGEDGKEAVLPLENNTGWMDDLAKKLASIMEQDLVGGVTPSVVYSGDVINNYNYNQTINSPTALTRKEIYRDSKNLLALKGV